MAQARKLVILDRDGVLNPLRIDPEHGTINSPLHPDQVFVFPWAAEAVMMLNQAGYSIAIATNQPAAAKGKTTQTNLEHVHSRIIEACEGKGGKILSSHVCFHRQEDQCECRKPKPGLLKEIFSRHSDYEPRETWMIGDGVTDIQAGKSLGLKTGFLGPRKCDACRIFDDLELCPDFWGETVLDFAKDLIRLI